MDPKDELPAKWPPLDAEGMLRCLSEHGVDFVVIGGMALVLSGSARLTRDLDVVFASDPANLEALGEALVSLDARLREVGDELPFVPDGRTLANIQLLTLTTSSGWLDVHREVDGMPAYESMRSRAERMSLGEFSIRVAHPEDMISMKRAAGRPQDLADIAEWEAINRLRSQGEDAP